MIWKRVVLDRTGGTNFVVQQDLKGIDLNWEGKVPIWKDVTELDNITLEMIETNFIDKVSSPKKQACPTPKKKRIFSEESYQKMFITLSKIPKAEVVLNAIDNLNENELTVDNLNALIRIWPIEINDLMDQFVEDPQAQWG